MNDVRKAYHAEMLQDEEYPVALAEYNGAEKIFNVAHAKEEQGMAEEEERIRDTRKQRGTGRVKIWIESKNTEKEVTV